MTPDELILFTLHSLFASQLGDALFTWFSSRSAFSLPILFSLLVVAVHRERWQGLVWWAGLILAVAVADQFGNQLKSLFSEMRPCADPQNLLSMTQDLVCSDARKGMPSNHALTFYTASLFVIITRPAWRGWHLLLLVAALMSSLSRIYLAKHYPSQVLAGVFAGIDLGVIAALVYRCGHWLGTLRRHLVGLLGLQPWLHMASMIRSRAHAPTSTTTQEMPRHANLSG